MEPVLFFGSSLDWPGWGTCPREPGDSATTLACARRVESHLLDQFGGLQPEPGNPEAAIGLAAE